MTDAIKHLFLDLEDTVITPVVCGWSQTELINVDKVRAFIAHWEPNHVHLFSFALRTKQDLTEFETLVRPGLEAALGLPLSLRPTVEDHILPACCRARALPPVTTVTFSEMARFWGKQGAFRLYAKDLFCRMPRQTRVEVTLLDDGVTPERFEWPDKLLKGHLLNINDLP